MFKGWNVPASFLAVTGSNVPASFLAVTGSKVQGSNDLRLMPQSILIKGLTSLYFR